MIKQIKKTLRDTS